MLTALIHGKGRRLTEHASAEESLRMAFGRFEDLLTATVFERLAYLSGDTLWGIIRDTFAVPACPKERVAKLKAMQFWPMWSAATDTLGKSVEPDVVLQMLIGESRELWTFIIECKLGRSQDLIQLCDEWEAFRYEAAGEYDPHRTMLLALGGLWSDRRLLPALADYSQKRFGKPLFGAAAGWSDLMNAVARASAASSSEARVLVDIRQALELHGHRIASPLRDLAGAARAIGVRAGCFSISQRGVPDEC